MATNPYRSWSLCLLLCACGGSKEPPAAPEASKAEAPASESEPAAAADKPAEASAPAKTEDKPAEDKPAAAASDENAPRDVKYVQSPEGLRVEVSGVRFEVTAKAVKSGGGYGVKVSVRAEAIDKKTHSLLSTDNGPLAFAGNVTRKGQTVGFGDERKGEGEKAIDAASPSEFAREWPAKGGEKPLANGDSVELAVGLWGVGDNAESRRPLKKFALVKVKVEGNKARAILEAPPNASSK
jgi:hypothetical protein